jgi:DNA-binding NtrC family response regulator
MPHIVLLVDDDPDALSGLAHALRREPYQVLTAESGEGALAALAETAADAVVSDESMPGMPGTALLAQVRALHPETMRILLTGHADLEVALRAINHGEVFRFLTKPCKPLDLALTIRDALRQRDLLRSARRLLDSARRQSAAIAALEREWSGLTHVDRDESGAIVVAEPTADLDELLREALGELDRGASRLRARPRGGAES